MSKPQPQPVESILDCMGSPDLFGPWFSDPSWDQWRAMLAVLFGLRLPEGGLELFRRCTGADRPLAGGYKEAWLVVGRRGGKSFVLALVATFLAIWHGWRQYLRPGEIGTIMIIAADRKQARTIFRYISGFFNFCPTLKEHFLEAETAESIRLTNSIVIEISTCSFRRVRGYTVVACLLDEIAYWDVDGANPDDEVVAALRPSMATIPDAILLCASSPYVQRGELFRAFDKYHGVDGAPVLVWRAPSREMNPTIGEATVQDAFERDPDRAESEWNATFRRDIETFLSRVAIEACVETGRADLPPSLASNYVGFCDPAGGSGRDSMSLAISYFDRDDEVTRIVNLVERRPPFDPDIVTEEFSKILKEYRCSKVSGDRYAADWVVTSFRKHGIIYEHSKIFKSEIYENAMSIINQGSARFPDNDRLFNQLCSLERRQGRGGKPIVDHPPGGNDDLANVACGALMPAVKVQEHTRVIMDPFGEARVSHDSRDTPAQAAARERRNAVVEGDGYKMPTVHLGRLNPNLFRT